MADLLTRATGGAGRDRTGDLLNANQALSQLSYSPRSSGSGILGLGSSCLHHVPNPKSQTLIYFSRPIGRKDREDQPRDRDIKTTEL